MRPQRTGLLVMAMMFMMVLARVFSGGPAQAADPDFTHVTDILNGQRQLLRTDDLFIAGLFQRHGSVTAAGGILHTSNSSIVAVRPSFNSAVHGENPRRVTLKSARLFNVSFDDIVSSVTQGDSQLIFVPGVSDKLIHLPNHTPTFLFSASDSAVGDFTATATTTFSW